MKEGITFRNTSLIMMLRHSCASCCSPTLNMEFKLPRYALVRYGNTLVHTLVKEESACPRGGTPYIRMIGMIVVFFRG